jgi:hypothetical protein
MHALTETTHILTGRTRLRTYQQHKLLVCSQGWHWHGEGKNSVTQKRLRNGTTYSRSHCHTFMCCLLPYRVGWGSSGSECMASDYCSDCVTGLGERWRLPQHCARTSECAQAHSPRGYSSMHYAGWGALKPVLRPQVESQHAPPLLCVTKSRGTGHVSRSRCTSRTEPRPLVL